MPQIDFEFELDTKVKTKFGDVGFIEDLAYSRSGIRYWVQIDMDNGRWFSADEFEVLPVQYETAEKSE